MGRGVEINPGQPGQSMQADFVQNCVLLVHFSAGQRTFLSQDPISKVIQNGLLWIHN